MNCDAGDMMTFVKDNDPSANEEVEAEQSLKL